jgi:ribosomal protein L32
MCSDRALFASENMKGTILRLDWKKNHSGHCLGQMALLSHLAPRDLNCWPVREDSGTAGFTKQKQSVDRKQSIFDGMKVKQLADRPNCGEFIQEHDLTAKSDTRSFKTKCHTELQLHLLTFLCFTVSSMMELDDLLIS